MQMLTYEDVLAAGRKAWNEKRLTAQQESFNLRRCNYVVKSDDKEFCCVVGSAFNEETKARVQSVTPDNMYYNDLSVRRLVDDKIVKVSPNDVYNISQLQSAHDTLCRTLNEFTADSSEVASARECFMSMLGVSDGADAAAVGVASA